ncbi:hypothetical protein F8M41_009869 [Gigaspora margarita]|uniref:Uncharacterized protein n=1 Tax=Gigaspora margarita TaxID=4874 RepID=A0A8H4A3P5_GIGMA|nr:hypothetical protein F8M41_009869 [Gigaspora margarita]
MKLLTKVLCENDHYIFKYNELILMGKVSGCSCEKNALATLDISQNSIVVEAFAETLNVNNSLTSLDLSDNPLSVENELEELERSFNIRSTLTSCYKPRFQFYL